MFTPQPHFPALIGGAIIVTPEGQAYFPAARRMTPDQFSDWIASLNVTLPRARTAYPRGPFDMVMIRDCEADGAQPYGRAV